MIILNNNVLATKISKGTTRFARNPGGHFVEK